MSHYKWYIHIYVALLILLTLWNFYLLELSSIRIWLLIYMHMITYEVQSKTNEEKIEPIGILTWNMILYCSSGLFTTHMLQPIVACGFLRGCDSSMLFASWFSDVGVNPCRPITVIPPWDQRLRLCTPWKGFDVLFLVCFPHSGPAAVLIEVQPRKRDQRRCSIQPWESQGLIADEWSLWCLCAFSQLWISSEMHTQGS